MSADYEIPVTLIKDDQGMELKVVRHFRDGIVARDPEKVIIYDSSKAIVAETPDYRNVVVVRKVSGDRLYIYGIHILGIPFHQGWVFQNQVLRRMGFFQGNFFAILGSLQTHWVGYGCSLFVMFYALSAACGILPGFWVTIGGLWLFGVLMYSPLSLGLVLAIGLLAFLPFSIGIENGLIVLLAFWGVGLFYWLLLLSVAGYGLFFDYRKQCIKRP